MHLNANKLSFITIISSLVMFGIFPSSFSGDNNPNLSHKSSEFSEKKMIFNPHASIAL